MILIQYVEHLRWNRHLTNRTTTRVVSLIFTKVSVIATLPGTPSPHSPQDRADAMAFNQTHIAP